MNAPRALPIVSGPVGLAETNSTLTLRGRIGATRPHVAGDARIASTVASSARSARWRLMNPGGGHGRRRDRAAAGCRIVAAERRHDGLGDRQRRAAQRPGQLHREVRRQVAVLGLRRPRHVDRPGDVASSGTAGSAPDVHRLRPGRLDRLAHARANRRWDGRRRSRASSPSWGRSGPSSWAANASGRGVDRVRPGPLAAEAVARIPFRAKSRILRRSCPDGDLRQRIRPSTSVSSSRQR